MSSKKELLEKLANCVVEMEDEEVADVAKEYLNEGYLAFDGIMRCFKTLFARRRRKSKSKRCYRCC